MTSGLLASLSPPQEIALRRIAHGSLVVDAQVASTLIALALVEQTGGGLRLTPLGRLRFNALPKAPLLGQQRSIHAATGYVEGLIEKVQSRVANQDVHRKNPAQPPSFPAGLLLEVQEREKDPDESPNRQPVYLFLDSEQWKARVERRLIRTRRAMIEHRQRQIMLCDSSHRCIQASRLLLELSVPVRPRWLVAAK